MKLTGAKFIVEFDLDFTNSTKNNTIDSYIFGNLNLEFEQGKILTF